MLCYNQKEERNIMDNILIVDDEKEIADLLHIYIEDREL